MKFELKTENENYPKSISKCFLEILLVKNVLHSIIRKNFASKKL